MSRLFTITTNAAQVAQALRNIMRDTAQTATRRQRAIETAIRWATISHFQKLQWGGADTTALDGYVTWDQRRHPWTRVVRLHHGRHPVTPMLQVMDEPWIRNAWTNQAHSAASITDAGAGSSLAYLPGGGGEVRRIGTINQLGGYHHAKFRIPRNGKIVTERPLIHFPRRRFLYWDQQMLRQTLMLVNQEFESAKARHRV